MLSHLQLVALRCLASITSKVSELATTTSEAIGEVDDNLTAHKDNTSNPHSVTKSQVGLGNVDNTSDANKPVSTAQATAIAEAKKAGTDAQSSVTTHANNTSNPHSVTKSQVGLGNVPNVATNDQTPTYTQASALANLASGEKLSVSMGKIMKAIADFISHKDSTSNPHGVTKSQVGLSNVPNVATNDQTPTYTQASTLANLTSGEKLSVSMGKIMKAIADFITHKGSTSNPHSVTKAQVGLGSVDNTSDTNKPVSTAQATAIADAKKAGTDAQSNLSTHANNKSNPHGVTAEQVGAAPAYTYGTEDLTAGTSELETGKLHFVYE